MNGSILTNRGAMVALQTMKSINKSMGSVQDMISTGKRVGTSKDNAAIWAISSVMESDVSSFKAVTDSLALGQSTVAVARNAAEQVKDSLVEIKSKIIAAQEDNVDRDKIQSDVEALRSQIKSIVGASQFNGLNLLKSSENLEVLSSIDRSSNGSTTTSKIIVDAKSLDSGTAAQSVAGTAVASAVNTSATVTAAFVTTGNTNPATVTEGKATFGTFTNSSQVFDFTTTVALDEGDSVAFSFTDGTNTATFTYTQTATGAARTTGEELAKQLASAYSAFAARDADGNGVTTSSYNATTKTFTAAEGSFVVTGTGSDTLNTLELSADDAGKLTIVNKRDTGVIFTTSTETDRANTNIPATAGTTGVSGTPKPVAANSTAVDFDLSTGTIGLQQDDTYAFTLRNTTNSNASVAFSVTGASLTAAQLATTIHDALNAYKAGGISEAGSTSYDSGNPATSFTATSTTGQFTAANGATVSVNFTSAGSMTTEALFVDALDGTDGTATFTNGTSGVVSVTSATGGDALDFFGALTIGSSATAADISVSNTSNVAILTPTSADFTFTTTQAFDEGDTQEFNFSDGDDSIKITYTQTATGNAQTTGLELSAQLSSAFAAFKTGTNIGDGTNVGNFVASTNTYTSAEGTFVFENGTVGNASDLKQLLTLSDNGSGTLTVSNAGTSAVSFSAATEGNYTQTTLNTIANNQALAQSGSVTVDFGFVDTLSGTASNSSGLQSDDTYVLTIGESGATNGANGDTVVDADEASVAFSITGAAQSKAQLADTIQRITDAYANSELSSTATSYTGSDTNITYGGVAGRFNVNGATINIAFTQGTGSTQGAFQADLATDLVVTNGSSEQVVFTNASSTATDDYLIRGQLTIGTTSTIANVTFAGGGSVDIVATAGTIAKATGAGSNNITAGTIGDYLTIDVNNTANQVGDTLSIVLDGVNVQDGEAQPITYTAANGATESDIATGFAAAINTALSDAGIRDVIASTRTGGLIDIKNFNITTTKDVSKLSSVNELTTAAVATDSNGVAASSISAGATNKVTFGANKATKGDTYSVTVGSTTAKYTARDGDDLNTIGKNIEGLLKLKSNDNIAVDFTTVDNPESTSSVLTVKNNGTSAITSFSATVKSGGTVGGGLELLDDIDVTDAKKAEGSLDIIENLINVAIDAASSYGSSEKRLTNQQDFISKLTDSLKAGIGSLVDANLEETSARLQALQVQQQLGTQALSIANQSPQSILSLFR